MSIISGDVVANVSCGNKKAEIEERINKNVIISPEEKKLLFEELNGNQDQFTKAHSELEKRSDARQRRYKFVENCVLPFGGFSIAGLIGLGVVATRFICSTLLGMAVCGAATGFAVGSAMSFGACFFDKVLLKWSNAKDIINNLDNSIKNYREHHI